MADLGLSVVLTFDGSVLYGPSNASPTAAAIGYVLWTHEPILEGSRPLSTFVSSTHVEYRALVEGVRAVTALSEYRTVASLHVRGDAPWESKLSTLSIWHGRATTSSNSVVR